MNNLSLFLLGLVLIYVPVKAELCFSISQGYPCCKENNVIYTDESGDWGIEDGEWCGIGNGSDSCFAIAQGYPCCKSCEVVYKDESGDWGIENNEWCGITSSCTVKSLAVNDTDFEFSFLKMENNKKNMLYSPLSIQYALNMLQEGAIDNTYTEINNVIGNKELTKYTSIDKVLSLANGLFIRDTYFDYVKTSYINTLKEKYDAEVKKDEFKNAQNANAWIENKTLGIIKNMLKNSVFENPDNVMLLINALAIDMEWYSGFSFKDTSGRSFYLENGQEIETTMMSTKETSKAASYYINRDITVLTMDLRPYNGLQFEFMAIMPEGNLSDYVNNITKEQINEIDNKLIYASDEPFGVNIKIPKFKFSYDLELKKDLINLGIKDAFDKYNADFSNMSDAKKRNEALFVADALHKADIEFTERGIKAAAVTVIIMTAVKSLPPRITEPVNVTIDRPFMFIIRDKNTKDIWFTGTVYEPNLWENDREEYRPSRY